MKPWVCLFLLVLIAAAAAAAEPPARIKLLLPTEPLRPGQASRLTLELTGESGKPVAAPQDVPIQIAVASGLVTSPQVKVLAGTSRLDVPVRAAKAGLWKIEARSPGLASDFGVLACLAPKAAVVTRGAAELEIPAIAPRPGTGARVLHRESETAAEARRRPIRRLPTHVEIHRTAASETP
ncbi:MAG TPA: hypothetical protein VMW27_02005, partial [Thermoanaerobaculia bacterium]|nr:hypothetical protein [Thermoanaerobaculia bacterium]